jgi:hypothetical protein
MEARRVEGALIDPIITPIFKQPVFSGVRDALPGAISLVTGPTIPKVADIAGLMLGSTSNSFMSFLRD